MALFFVIAVAVILAVLFFGHLALYFFLISVFPALGRNLFAVQITIGILWIGFVVATLVSQKFNTIGTRTLYRIFATWIGFFIYLFLGAAMYAIVSLLFPTMPQQTALLVGEAIIGIAITLSIYGIVNANRIQITSVKIPIPNLPERWKSRKAVFLSDLHLGQVRGVRFAKRIVSKINDLEPDIIFIGGDLYDGVAVDAKDIIKPLSELRIPLGIYFVTGNHEEFSDNLKYLSAVRETGIKALMDEKVIVDGIQIVGVDYAHASKKEKFGDILLNMGIDRETPSILLKHVPSGLDVALKNGITLQLSGHTHRAQVFPFNLLTHLIFKGFDYGLRSLGPMWVYTSSGVGTWGPPLRVGTKSEIVEILFQ